SAWASQYISGSPHIISGLFERPMDKTGTVEEPIGNIVSGTAAAELIRRVSYVFVSGSDHGFYRTFIGCRCCCSFGSAAIVVLFSGISSGQVFDRFPDLSLLGLQFIHPVNILLSLLQQSGFQPLIFFLLLLNDCRSEEHT